jgi:hypothetical protein
VTHNAITPLTPRPAVAQQLSPQLVQWLTTGVVAQGTILPAGVRQARAIVRNQVGKQVDFGRPYLLRRLGAGSVLGTLLRGSVDASQLPLQARAGSRALVGVRAPPALVVYARGGYAPAPVRALAHAGGQEIGLPPQGQGPWHVAEAIRETVRSERSKPDGLMGTLKTDT